MTIPGSLLPPTDSDSGDDPARDLAQAEEFRQHTLDSDPDRTLTLDDLLEYGRDSLPLPDDESITGDMED